MRQIIQEQDEKCAQRGLFKTEEGEIGSIIFHPIRIKVFLSLFGMSGFTGKEVCVILCACKNINFIDM